MEIRTILLGGIALMMLSLGCTTAHEPQAKANDFGFEEQMLAVMPVIKPGMVMKVCNTNDKPGDLGSLQFSFTTDKPDPNNPSKQATADLPSLEEQLAAILPILDEHHALNLRSTTDKRSGQQSFVFTIQPREDI